LSSTSRARLAPADGDLSGVALIAMSSASRRRRRWTTMSSGSGPDVHVSVLRVRRRPTAFPGLPLPRQKLVTLGWVAFARLVPSDPFPSSIKGSRGAGRGFANSASYDSSVFDFPLANRSKNFSSVDSHVFLYSRSTKLFYARLCWFHGVIR